MPRIRGQQITDGTVTGADIQDLSILREDLEDEIIDNSKIDANAAISQSKIDSSSGWISNISSGSVPTLHVRDEKTAGTSGGTFSLGDDTGKWGRQRDLNTILTNTITGASLASNTITLPAGTYEIDASCPAYDVDRHKALLRDVTNSVDLVVGTSMIALNSDNVSNLSLIRGRFTLSATTNLEIWHKCTASSSSNGFGNWTDFGKNEVYTEAIFKKIS